MELKNKPRKDFYAPGLDMDRVFEMLKVISGQLTLEESLKMMREMVYDMTSYYGDEDNGIVYKNNYSENHIWQATMLGNGLRALCDVFNQSITDKREFDMDYFEDKWHLTGLQAYRSYAKEKIPELSGIILDLESDIEVKDNLIFDNNNEIIRLNKVVINLQNIIKNQRL